MAAVPLASAVGAPLSSLNLDINGATVNNVVKDLPVSGINSGEVSGPGLSGVTANIYRNGYEAGSFYMYNYLGIDANGKYIYEDLNGDGKIDANDRKISPVDYLGFVRRESRERHP